MTTLLYYDPATGAPLYTLAAAPGFAPPAGDHITVESPPADPHLWQVVDGELVEREDAAEIALQARREGASLSKAEFLLACTRAQLLSEEDALLASRGELPAAYATVIDGWPAAQRFEAGVRWAALTQVDRLHPLIVAVAQDMSIPDAALDALFGITAP